MLANTIVVGFDGSADARRALDVGMDHCAEDGVIHVVTAYHDVSYSAYNTLMSSLPDEYRNTFDPGAPWRDHLHDAEVLLDVRGIKHEGHLVEDHPASAILDTADAVGADLIIVGSRGLGGLKRFLSGSVSARLANHARTSLMIIRDDMSDNDR